MGPEEIKEVRPIRWNGKNGPYDITLRFAPLDGRMECVGLDVQAVPGPRPITAVALHSLPLGQLIEKRRKEAGDVTITIDTPGAITWQGQNVNIVVTRRGGRPPKYDQAHWEKVAAVYVEEYGRGSLTPTRAVARHFKVTVSAAAKWVAKCRTLGLLPETTRGKARVVQARGTGRIRLRSRATGKAVRTAKPKRGGGKK